MKSEQATKCPKSHLHAVEPKGYVEWHEWAKKKGRTHRQTRCPGCGLLKIWSAKKKGE